MNSKQKLQRRKKIMSILFFIECGFFILSIVCAIFVLLNFNKENLKDASFAAFIVMILALVIVFEVFVIMMLGFSDINKESKLISWNKLLLDWHKGAIEGEYDVILTFLTSVEEEGLETYLMANKDNMDSLYEALSIMNNSKVVDLLEEYSEHIGNGSENETLKKTAYHQLDIIRKFLEKYAFKTFIELEEEKKNKKASSLA